MILRPIAQANPAFTVRFSSAQIRRKFKTAVLRGIPARKVMGSTSTTYLNHEERTAAEPREHGMHSVIIDSIDQINSNVRLLRLRRAAGNHSLQARELSVLRGRLTNIQYLQCSSSQANG